MKNIFNTIKENTVAIITAFILFGLVTYYMVNVVPANERKIDAYNKARLNEFEIQFNSLLKDYASQLPLNSLDQKTDTNYINTMLIHSIRITGIDSATSRDIFKMKEEITYSFDSVEIAELNRRTPQQSAGHTKGQASYSVSKKEFIKKLSMATGFPDWIIYLEPNDANKDKDKIFLHDGINSTELDSLIKKPPVNGINSFVSFNKRYYSKSFEPESMDFKVVLTGAVSQSAFDREARQTDVSVTILCSILVILLFLIIPLLKPLISSARERLTQFDLIMTTGSICTAAVILSVTIFTWYFSKTETEKLKTDLAKKHNYIASSVNRELDDYVNAKNTLFTLVDEKKQPAHTDLETIKKNGKYKSTVFPEITFQMDKNALLKFDISHKSRFSIRKNYSDRDYITKVRRKEYDKVVSAVYSKYDNKFKTVYVQKDGEEVRGLAFEPKAIDLNSWSRDYGFVLCDKEGRVLLHSDSSKRLNENLFSVCRNAPEFIQLSHGFTKGSFEVEYNGYNTLFYGQRLNYASADPGNSAPLYLFTFKKLFFEDGLKTYSIVKGIMVSVVFALFTMFLLLFYSVFFYSGHLSVFSKGHVYWLFPDKSRAHEFSFITKLNYIAGICVLILLFIFPNHGLFIAMISGIHLAFINFVLLTQRAFLFRVRSKKRTRHLLRFAIAMALGMVISSTLYVFHFASWALAISIVVHLSYLWFLKRDKNSVNLSEILKSVGAKKYNYNSFLFSIISYHYLLVPAIIVFSIFINETSRMNDFNSSFEKKALAVKTPAPSCCADTDTNSDAWYYAEGLFNRIPFPTSPSFRVLKGLDFDVYRASEERTEAARQLLSSGDGMNMAWLFITLILLSITILKLGGFFTGRFFFTELSELARKNKALYKSQHPHTESVFPPFHKQDLEKIEAMEIGPIESYVFPSGIEDPSVSQHKKLELIYAKVLEVHKSEYRDIWDRLSVDEKFVMYDFALDYFVNNKNKIHLMSLISKGLIMEDPTTGRLRVMNYGFRNFVIWFEKHDPEFSAEDMEKDIKGTFAKWRLPLIITGISVLILISFLYKEQSDKILIFGTSTLSTFGLISKFLNNYTSK